MRLLLALLLGTGCAHRGGMPVPGPLGSLGQEVGYEEAGLTRREEPAEAPRPSRAERRRAKQESASGHAVAKGAGALVGKTRTVVDGRTYRADCSGFVAAAYAKAGLELDGSSADLFELSRELGVLHKKKLPLPGDIAFFDDTYDRNGNGRRDDELSHVAVVEKVEEDGTIILVHRGNAGVVRIRMNLREPHVARREDGVVLNDGLRAGRQDGGPRLTGELWRAFGSLWSVPPEKLPSDGVAAR